MITEAILRVVIEKPFNGVAYAVQKGKGSDYEIEQRQISVQEDLRFEIAVPLKFDENGTAVFSGPFAQGPPKERFVYIRIGTYAGQSSSPWGRRLKIPLTGISKADLISYAVLETRVPGIGKDGGPNCATVKPFEGWKPV